VVVAPAGAMTLISRSTPATSSAGTASWGQDASYGGTEWGFHIADIGPTGTLAYDLSGVPSAQRRKILVALYMARGDPYYQLNYRAAASYTPDDTPDAYVLEGASQAAGPWTALITVATNNNQYKTHLIADFSPYSFLRFRSTMAPASGCRVKMDVYDASAGVTDGIVFYGDSITTNIFQGGFNGFPPQWFSRQIQASHPAFFPFVIGGGWPATTSLDGIDLVITASGTNFTAGLSTPLKTIFSNARYAALIWGANDAPDQTLVDGFRSHYTQIVNALRAQGQVVIIASPTWAPAPERQAGLVQIRAAIGFHLPTWVAKTYAAGDYVWNSARAYQCTTAGTSVSGPSGTGTGTSDGGTARWSYVPSLREDYAQDSGVIPGPDLYSVFLNHPEWLVDGLHPNAAGEDQWRAAWVNWAGSTLYGP
jgi:lysophospholipase L1-like esterase